MAIKSNIIVDQGTSFFTSIDLTDENDQPIDLTGYTGAAQIRKHYTSSNSAAFTVTLGGELGTVDLELTPAQTANITSGRYLYDVELTSESGLVSRIVEGIVTVTPQITR